MTEFEFISSSDDEEENTRGEGVDCDDSKSSELDVLTCHPAAWTDGLEGNGSIAYRHHDVEENHPAAVRSVKRDAKKASKFKEMGNEKYKAGLLSEAIELYSDALDFCPETDDFKYSAAVYLGNRAACFLRLGHYQDVVEDCTDALELDPRYVKAYMRRAQAYEKQDDLDSALKDWTQVVEIDPTIFQARSEQLRLDAIVKERNEKMKDEMLGKLKDLGNTVLGKFGMSLDNFNAVQDPNTGSYSISYNPS